MLNLDGFRNYFQELKSRLKDWFILTKYSLSRRPMYYLSGGDSDLIGVFVPEEVYDARERRLDRLLNKFTKTQ